MKTAESMAIEVLRKLMTDIHREDVAQIVIHVSDEVANFLNNNKRTDLVELEKLGELTLLILPQPAAGPEYLEMEYFDRAGNVLRAL